MPNIRPVSDLRNRFADITKEAAMSEEPIFLTKNGYGSLVVMSMDAYEKGLFESQVYAKLKEAEAQAKSGAKRTPHGEVMQKMREKISAKQDA